MTCKLLLGIVASGFFDWCCKLNLSLDWKEGCALDPVMKIIRSKTFRWKWPSFWDIVDLSLLFKKKKRRCIFHHKLFKFCNYPTTKCAFVSQVLKNQKTNVEWPYFWIMRQTNWKIFTYFKSWLWMSSLSRPAFKNINSIILGIKRSAADVNQIQLINPRWQHLTPRLFSDSSLAPFAWLVPDMVAASVKAEPGFAGWCGGCMGVICCCCWLFCFMVPDF